MLMSHRGQQPVVPESAYVAPTAVVCGAVTLGENVRILHGAVVQDEVFIATGVSIFPGARAGAGSERGSTAFCT